MYVCSNNEYGHLGLYIPIYSNTESSVVLSSVIGIVEKNSKDIETIEDVIVMSVSCGFIW